MIPNLGNPLSFSSYDKRKYDTLDPSSGYDLWSKTYDVDLQGGFFENDLLNSIAGVQNLITNKNVLDIGCGTGRIGLWINSYEPKSLIGIDLSHEMVQSALSKNVYNHIYNIDVLDLKDEIKYNLIISSLMLCHIQDLSKFMKKVNDLSTNKCHLIILDYHPFFLLNWIPTHFHTENNKGISITNYIHMFSSIFDSCQRKGWKLDLFLERFVTQEWIDKEPNMKGYMGQPISYLMMFSTKNKK